MIAPSVAKKPNDCMRVIARTVVMRTKLILTDTMLNMIVGTEWTTKDEKKRRSDKKWIHITTEYAERAR